MEPTRAKVPTEAIEAYNDFIHNHLDRRRFMDQLKNIAGASAALSLMEALTPDYAAAQQVAPTDARLKTSREDVPSPMGNGTIKGYLARPAAAGTNKLPAIVVIHENRGLNPHIEDVARRFALANFMAFAPDALTPLGGYPGDDVKGGEMFGKLDAAKRTEDLVAAAYYVKNRPDSTGKLGATGFCFGGGIANTLAVRMGADLAAAAPYYGGAPMAADVPKIKAAILVHHGGEDARLVMAWPRLRQGAYRRRRDARRTHLSRRRPRVQQRRHSGAVQQGRRRHGVGQHDRLVQQVREGLRT
jgi:carboxymethylenebutenolidase